MARIGKPPPGVDLTATRYPLLAAVGLSSWALGFIAIALRIVCRRITKSPLWLDDWLIIASMVFISCGLVIITKAVMLITIDSLPRQPWSLLTFAGVCYNLTIYWPWD